MRLAVLTCTMVVSTVAVVMGTKPGSPTAQGPTETNLSVSSNTLTADIVTSLSKGGTTVVINHDPETGAEQSQIRCRTAPMGPAQIMKLAEIFGDADKATAKAIELLASRATSPETEKKLVAASRSTTLRSIALTEARAGVGFEVLDGPPPYHDPDWHMYTLPSPGRDNHIWVIPISKKKYPQVAELERGYRAASRALDDTYCLTWNSMPFARRKQIVDEADAAELAMQSLGTILRQLESAGATQHVEYVQAKQELAQLHQRSNRKPLHLTSNLEAKVGVTIFNNPP
jgi:hypothetical protein